MYTIQIVYYQTISAQMLATLIFRYLKPDMRSINKFNTVKLLSGHFRDRTMRPMKTAVPLG
jgi:hypothetical protein